MTPTDREAPLSEAGQLRRRDMLTALHSEMTALHRRRRRRRAAVAGGVVMLLAAAIAIGTWPTTDHPSASPSVAIAHDPLRPGPVITIIQTDPDILDRYMIRSTRPLEPAEQLDDESLLAELATIDPTLGLIRVGTRAWVWGLDEQMLRP